MAMSEGFVMLFLLTLGVVVYFVARIIDPKPVRYKRRKIVQQPVYHGRSGHWPNEIRDESYGVLEEDHIELR